MELDRDFSESIASCAAHRVRFLIVGGHTEMSTISRVTCTPPRLIASYVDGSRWADPRQSRDLGERLYPPLREIRQVLCGHVS